MGWSQWPRGLRRGSAASRLLGLWVRIPQGTWMSVSCNCCVLSGRVLCAWLITRPEESYRLWCVVVCDIETSWMGRPGPTKGGGSHTTWLKKNILCKNNNAIIIIYGKLQDLFLFFKISEGKRNNFFEIYRNLGTRHQKFSPALVSAISL